MAGNVTSSRGRAITGINVTPLVDITLVLLIVFMVTAKLIVGQKGITVDLPKARTGGEVQEVFSVTLDPKGIVQINGQTVPNDEEFSRLASAAKRNDPDVRAVLKADGALPHERVMHVLDQLRVAGIGKVAFGVSPVSSATLPPTRQP